MSTEQKAIGIFLLSLSLVSILGTLYMLYLLVMEIFVESIGITYLVNASLIAIAIWIVLFISAYVLDWCFAWINDGKMYHRNRLLEWLMKKKGYVATAPNSTYFYIKKTNNYTETSADGCGTFIQVGFLFMSIPWVIYFFYHNPIVFLSISLFIGLMYLARFSIRMGKKLKSHIEDVAMHSSNKEEYNVGD